MEKIIPKEDVIWKIWQSIKIYIKNPIVFSALIFVYILILAALFYLFSQIDEVFIWEILANTSPYLLWLAWIIMFIILIISWNLIYLHNIYNAKKIINWEKIDIKTSFIFSTSNIFLYILNIIKITFFWLLKQILILLLWWIVMWIWWFISNQMLLWIWWFILIVWYILMIMEFIKIYPSYFMIINNKISPREALKKSKIITKWKWWRTFWNFLLLSIFFKIIEQWFVLIFPENIEVIFIMLLLSITSPIGTIFLILLYKRYELESKEWESFEEFKNSEEFKKIKEEAKK